VAGPLGLLMPTDDRHRVKYPLTALPTATVPLRVPVVLGTFWYSSFDRPLYDDKTRRWWVGRGDLGRIRGGHAYCAVPRHDRDHSSWWTFYDQGYEGACVGFAASRMMTLLNRKRYAARWLWDRSKEIDEWSDTNPGDSNGTSVRAAMDVLRTRGHRQWVGNQVKGESLEHGIAANRWATTVDEVLLCLGDAAHWLKVGGIPFRNSWGRDYPHTTYMPLDVLARLLREDGEATVIVDR
jgi:hypothetical protein